MCQCRFLYNRRVRKLLLCTQAVERNGVQRDYLNCTLQMNSYTGWTPLSAVSRCLNLLSVQKSAFCPLVEKLWIGSKNGWHPLCRARRALPPCKVWGGDRTARAGCRCENVAFVCLFFSHAPRSARCSFDGGRLYFEQVSCRCLWVDFEAAKNSNNNSVWLLLCYK